MSLWYIRGADGKDYCWAKEPSYRCPIGSAERLGDILEAAAEELGVGREWLLRKIKHAGRRARVDGRLTDRCAECGHKLERLGFHCSIRVHDDEQTVAGFTMAKMEKQFYLDTKREAERWAREEVRLTHSIKEEQDAAITTT